VLVVRARGRTFGSALAGLDRIGSPDRWLISLRSGAVAGMAVTTLAARLLVPSLGINRVLVILAATLLINVLWLVLVNRGAAPHSTVRVQILGDVVVLASILWFTGGLGNPFAVFLVFQIALAGLLGDRTTMVLVVVLTVVAAIGLSFAPRLPLTDARWGAAATSNLARVLSFAALTAFASVVVHLCASRIDELRREKTSAERLAGLGRTVAALCHELNTPLGTILIAGRDVALIGRESQVPEVERLGGAVADGARRASDVIGMMRGSLGPDAPVETLDLCSLVGRHAEEELDRRGFRGERRIKCEGVAMAQAVRTATCHIVSNLIANGVDATNGAAQGCIAVEVSEDESGVRVSVSDNGPGVDPRVLKSLGEPFQTTKADRGASGLGLYVSSVLAERMGGTISIDSRGGVGTTVALWLPRDGRKSASALH
jgi:two-component system sensor histidine kinase RegB